MRSLITQSIVLPASADELFQMYLNSEDHAAITGGPVVVHAEPGAKFQAFNGTLSGVILHVVKSKLVVQTWRSATFNSDDPDATLILNFSPEGEYGRIDMIHLDVPVHKYSGVKSGWNTYYWQPWRKYLMQHA